MCMAISSINVGIILSLFSFVPSRYASSEFMTTDDLLIFLEAEQGVSIKLSYGNEK